MRRTHAKYLVLYGCGLGHRSPGAETLQQALGGERNEGNGGV
jgi:hypothetical protein